LIFILKKSVSFITIFVYFINDFTGYRGKKQIDKLKGLIYRRGKEMITEFSLEKANEYLQRAYKLQMEGNLEEAIKI